MSATEEPRRRKGRILALVPVAIFALVGGAFYWGLFKNVPDPEDNGVRYLKLPVDAL
jgi:hypothetical protein